MTGRYPLHTGIHNYISYSSNIGVPLEEEFLPSVLKTVGYQCHAVGKWHLGHSRWRYTPTFRGFDSFYGMYLGSGDYFEHDITGGYDLRMDDRPNCGLGCSRVVDERGNYSSHVFVREAIRVIHDHADEEQEDPLFLYLAFQAVHAPDQVPESYRRVYENQTSWSEMRKTYAGMLSAADEGVGNVTQALKEMGMWDNTLVIFTTDNGGPTETCAVQGSSNSPRRGGKCTVWEGGTTGDGFISGPALAQYMEEAMSAAVGQRMSRGPPLRHEGLFHCVDWLPTLAAMVGATRKGKKPLDGVNQWDSLIGKSKTAPRTEVFVGIGLFSTWGPAMRHGRWKLIENSGGPSLLSADEEGNETNYHLYDLSIDRIESNNLALDKPFVLEWMKEKLELYKSEMVPIPKEDPSCPFEGFVNTSIGPAWIPWCGDKAKEVVIYSQEMRRKSQQSRLVGGRLE